jgi:L-serine kinase (ATP) / ParB family transcriptional regulator, heme-responsive regulator
MSHTTAPMPDLRIVDTERLRAHEDHDSQRSEPLIERLRHEATIINPPVVAPLPTGDFVILDGANRAFALRAIGCPHALVQVATYHHGVDLSIWRHVVCDWDIEALFGQLRQMDSLEIAPRSVQSDALGDGEIATISAVSGEQWTVAAAGPDARTNAPLRDLVQSYQTRATLQRTALDNPDQVWEFHPTAAALIAFRAYQPEDIMRAALDGDFLPPGVSRHIVHGRAIRVNYPMIDLRDPYTPLDRKNESLRRWLQEKVAARRVRYYAEATFQFDE